jgi:hypothetical protein
LGHAPRAVPLARIVARPSADASAARAIVVEVASTRVHVPSGATRDDLIVVLDALEARVRGGTW